MKINKLFKITTLTLAILFTGAACDEGFEEMNTDPFNPTESSSAFLFNGVASTTPFPGDLYLYVWSERLFQWSQLGASRGGGGQDLNTGAVGDNPNSLADLGRNQMWYRYYGMIRTFRALEQNWEEDIDPERLVNQKAMGNILFAYRTLQITDMYGDMPLEEAGKGFTEGIPRPSYNTQQEVYRAMLDLIDTSLSTMVLNTDGQVTSQGNAYLDFGVNETLFQNDMVMWQKFGNSLKLRYGLRIQNVDPALAQSTVTSAMQGPLFEIGEGLTFGPGTAIYSGFQWFAFQRMGSRIWNEMNGGIDGAADGSDIVDPRVYAWFEGNRDLEWVPMPQNWGTAIPDVGIGFPGQDIRRNDNDGLNPDDGLRGIYSGFNWYTVENSANSYEYHVWGTEVALMKAEAAALGWGASPGDAIAWYNEGVAESMRIHHAMPTLHENFAESTLDYPELTDADIDAYLALPRYALAGDGSAADHQKIVRQRWLNYFWNTNEAWAITRRTDLIELEPITTSTGTPVPTAMRITYPEDEPINNSDAYAEAVSRQGGDEIETTLWWTK